MSSYLYCEELEQYIKTECSQMLQNQEVQKIITFINFLMHFYNSFPFKYLTE
jgi:hypothetical protein